MWIDLTMPMSASTVPVPGHPSPSFEPLHSMEADGVRNTIARLSLHTGTHIDAPSHFIPDGQAIDQLDPGRFVRPGVKLDLTGAAADMPISLADLEAAGFSAESAAGRILVLATGWSHEAGREQRLYLENPYLAEDAATAIAQAAPSALALDFAVDRDSPWPNHTILLGSSVLLIENLVNLTSLPEDGFEVLALPLRLAGENGSPARVLARLDAGAAAGSKSIDR